MFDRARNILLYANFAYGLLVVGEAQAFAALELALKHRLAGNPVKGRETLRNLVDRARKAAAGKRGGHWLRDGFTEALELPIPDGTDLAALDRALNELESVHERMAKVVELRYFVGLEVADIAGALGITERTARRDWVAAREWLRDRLEQPA